MGDTRFTIYTPVWDDEGDRFRAWLCIGEGWRDEQGEMRAQIVSMPINPDENFTGYIRFVESGKPPPEPLNMPRDVFMETTYAAGRGRASGFGAGAAGT